MSDSMGIRAPLNFFLVGMGRLELPASCSQGKRATNLRHIPMPGNEKMPFPTRMSIA